MHRLTIILTVFLSACGLLGPNVNCSDLTGTYTGTLSGTVTGTLSLNVASSSGTEADLTGHWTADDTWGSVNRADLDCETGTFQYEYALSLEGPSSLVCPSPECEPGETGGGCYCNGATLGEVEGTLDTDGGSGTWRADSGAAEYLGTTGSGTWSVSR